MLMEKKINIVMTYKGTALYLVKAVSHKDYEMEVKFDNLSMVIQLPQGTMEFSSNKNDKQDILSMLLAEIKNYTFPVRMTKDGKVTDVKNIDMLFESILNKFQQIPENQKAQIKAQLLKAFGAKAFKGNMEMVTAIYPDKPVNKGDSWVINTKLESGISANVTTTYKYSENSSDYNLIVGNSKLETADKNAYVKLNGMQMKYDLTGNMISEIKVDKMSGWIIEAKIKQDYHGDVYLKENPQMPDEMKIPMILKNDITFSNK